MASGFFLGGAAEGFRKQSDINDTQDRTGLLARQQSLREQQDAQSVIDTQVNNTMKVVSDTIKSATDAGKDPSLVAKAVQPLIESAASLASRAPNGQEYSQRVMATGQAMLGRVAGQPDQSFSGHVVSNPTVENPLGQSFVVLDKKSGAAKTVPIGEATPGPQSSVAPPTQVASLNLTGPDKTITGVSATDIPEGAPAVPSSAPIQTAQAGPGALSSDSIDFRARQWVDGNPDAFKNLPRSKAGMVTMNAIINRGTQIAKDGGITPEELNSRTQKFKAISAGAQVLGKRDAQLAGSIAVVTATAPIVSELSQKINRTEYPLVNKIITSGLEQTGDPTVVRLGIALNTVTNAYARAQGGGNNVLSDSARHEAQSLLQMAYSDGQLQAGVDQLLVEMQRESSKVGDALNDYLKLKKQREQSNAPPPERKFITPGGTGFTIIK